MIVKQYSFEKLSQFFEDVDKWFLEFMIFFIVHLGLVGNCMRLMINQQDAFEKVPSFFQKISNFLSV